jgi:hypothetical protein
MFCPKLKSENYDLGLVEDARKGLNRSRDSIATSLSPGRSSFTLWAHDFKKNEQVEFIIDSDIYEKIKSYVWYLDGRGYIQGLRANPIGFRGSLARIIMGLSRGVRFEVDHKNHNTLDNRRENLRITTKTGNQWNRLKSTKQMSISRFKGAHKRGSKWYAAITINGKPTYLGSFKTELAAARSYDQAAKKYFKEFACLNFPNSNTHKEER